MPREAAAPPHLAERTRPGRRGFLAGAALLPRSARSAPALDMASLHAAVGAAERGTGGRLGVAIRVIGQAGRFAWRGEERFPVTSTFKLVLAAAVLAAVDAGREALDRPLPIRPGDLVEYAPVTGPHVGGAMTIRALCAATMVWSDNPAANLLLPLVGGPAGLTGFARQIGDDQFRLDRIETALNEATLGDPRDTTTPSAMLGTLEQLLLGPVLSETSRAQLRDWMVDCRTGDRKLRAGLPAGWRCGDKTGGGGNGTNNDIAILWPPSRPPILVAAYLTGSQVPRVAQDAALAAVGRVVVSATR